VLALRAFASSAPRVDPEESAVESGLLDFLQGEVDVSSSANIAAFLLMIRKAEGTGTPDGYRMMAGGDLFEGFADHPRIRVAFKNARTGELFLGADGKPVYTTAAGAYQFTMRTWDDLAGKLGLPDFSPYSQDRGAVELLRERGALDAVESGDFDNAVSRVASIWASLPGSPHGQNSRSLDYVRTAYAQAGGVFA
jgi:lysozyme